MSSLKRLGLLMCQLGVIGTLSLMSPQALGQLGRISAPDAGSNASEGLKKETVSIEQVAAWGGLVSAFEQRGSIGYTVSGERLVLLDVTDPANMTEIGSLRMRSPIMDLVLSGNYVYVLTQGQTTYPAAGFPQELSRRVRYHVVDVSDPASPELVWSDDKLLNGCPILAYPPRAIHIWDDRYAMIHTGSKLSVWDLADPAHPKPIVSDLAPCGYRWEINTLDIERAISGLDIEFATTESYYIEGDLLYVPVTVSEPLRSYTALWIFDLSTIDTNVIPTSDDNRWVPQLIGQAEFPQGYRYAHPVTVSDGVAYLPLRPAPNAESVGAPDYQTLWAIDVSDPTNPSLMGSTFVSLDPDNPDAPKGGFHSSVQAHNGLVYAPAWGGGRDGAWTWCFDMLSNPSEPAVVSVFGQIKRYLGVTAAGDTLYVRDAGEGLVAYDVTDPSNASRLGSFHSPGELNNTAKRGDLLYVADSWYGLTILDVSDPASPTIVGRCKIGDPDGFDLGGLTLDDDGLIYFTAKREGLKVIDATDPTNPTVIGSWDEANHFDNDVLLGVVVQTNPDGTKTAFVSGDVAFGDLHLVDVTDPTDMHWLPFDWIGFEFFTSIREHTLSIALDKQRGMLYLPAIQQTNTPDQELDYNLVAGFDVTDQLAVETIFLDGAGKDGGNVEQMDVVLDEDRARLWFTSEYGHNGATDALFCLDVSDPRAGTTQLNLTEAPSGTRFGGLALHPRGLLAAVGYPDALVPGVDNLSQLLLFDDTDPANLELLASTILPFHATTRCYITAEESTLYVTHTRNGGYYDEDAGLSIYTVTSSLQLRADLTGPGGVGKPDGSVTMDDLSAFINAWIEADTDVADMTGAGGKPDGYLTHEDLSFFVKAWLAERK